MSFIPDAQDQKLAAIAHAAAALDTTINPANIQPAPSDAETVQALESAATGLSQVAGEDKGAGATAASRQDRTRHRNHAQARSAAAATLPDDASSRRAMSSPKVMNQKQRSSRLDEAE
jgi:hypothetical protein